MQRLVQTCFFKARPFLLITPSVLCYVDIKLRDFVWIDLVKATIERHKKRNDYNYVEIRWKAKQKSNAFPFGSAHKPSRIAIRVQLWLQLWLHRWSCCPKRRWRSRRAGSARWDWPWGRCARCPSPSPGSAAPGFGGSHWPARKTWCSDNRPSSPLGTLDVCAILFYLFIAMEHEGNRRSVCIFVSTTTRTFFLRNFGRSPNLSLSFYNLARHTLIKVKWKL